MNNERATSQFELLRLIQNKEIADLYYLDNEKALKLSHEAYEDLEEVNGRIIRNVAIKMAERKNLEDTSQELEEFLSLADLKSIKKCMNKALDEKLFDYEFLGSSGVDSLDSLSKQEFLDCLSELYFYYDYENELERMFHKIDSKNTGRVNWHDCASYFLMYHKEKEYAKFLKPLPFNNKPKIRHSLHNQSEVTVRILHMDNPWRFINVGRRGSIGLWDKNLEFVRRFQINVFTNSQSANYLLHHSTRSLRSSIWIVDACMLGVANRICLATSKRDLRFFTLNSEVLIEELNIHGLPCATLCLHSHLDKQTGKVTVFVGDTNGNLHMIRFPTPKMSMFNRVYKDMKKTMEINWKELYLHQSFIEVTTLSIFDDSSIDLIRYNSLNNTIILTNNVSNSLYMIDPESKRKSYVFNLEHPCICFDLSMTLHTLVTASKGSAVKVWDMYSTQKPVTILESHHSTVISVKIHETVNYLYSLSQIWTLDVWDLKDETLIQYIELYFPLYGFALEHGPFPMELFLTKSESNIIVACKDYLAYIAIGENLKMASSVPLSHNGSVMCALYSSLFKFVITCSYDSSITFWNLITGKKFISIQRAHGGFEITSMCLDEEQRTLFSGAINGTIMAWNVANGQAIQVFETFGDSEINGLSFLEKKRTLISVGSNKRIVTYNDVSFDTIVPIPPRLIFGQSTEHTDDIMCCDYYMGLLATGSNDGEILIWSLDNQKLLFPLVRNADKTLKNENAIDKLCFVQEGSRNYRGLNSIVLISSSMGSVSFWIFSLNKDQRLFGSFYASAFPNQYILAMSLNHDNSILITGDSTGFIYLWDIKNSTPSLTRTSGFQEPKLVKAWKCHDSSVLSCLYIKESDKKITQDELILTTSTDWTCRLWTMQGAYVGAFGQELKWNLNDVRTYQSLSNFESESSQIARFKKLEYKKFVRVDSKLSGKDKPAVDANQARLDKYSSLNTIRYFNEFQRFKSSGFYYKRHADQAKNHQKLNKLLSELEPFQPFAKLPIQTVANFSKEVNTEAFKKIKRNLPALFKS